MSKRFVLNCALPMALTVSCLLTPSFAAVTTPVGPLPDHFVHVSEKNTTPSQELFEGRVLGRSTKAGIITLKTAAHVEMIRFDEQTVGLEYAAKGEAAIIHCLNGESGLLAKEIQPKPAVLPPGIEDIEPDELAELISDGGAGAYLLVDARSGRRFEQGHIPTAISLPLPDLQKDTGQLAALAGQETTIIFYSDGPTCGLCTEAARITSGNGRKRVKVMLAGAQGWEDEEGLLAAGDHFVSSGRAVVVDVRNSKEARGGHIPGAVNLPVDDLAEAEYDFPVKKSAPIVLYGSAEQTEGAQEVVSGWGYRSVLMVDGGLQGWQQRGGKVSPGMAPGSDAISWTMQADGDQVSVKEFKKIAAKENKDILILDVRTATEAARGKLKNSMHIPLEELAARLDEIPTEKEVLTHCKTGARAEMAALFLGQYVAQVRYLPAKVRCKGEKCRIK